VVPYLADTKVKVSFNNIKLNTDRKLIEGIIETTYDPTEKNIVNVGDILNDLGNLIDGIVKIIDDAIGNDGMSQSDYDKLFDDVNNLIGKNNQDTSSLYDQGLITPKLKKEIEDLEQKIKDELKDLTCAVKDDKKKGSDEVAETDCIQKLKNLKADIEELKSKNTEKDEMRCIWNIAPNENLKGKTYYFQISEKNNDGKGKKLYKLKEGDYPISFNKNEAVYTFKSKGKIYRPFSDNSYYFSNTSEDKYVFETGDAKSLVDIKIDDNNANAVTINGVQITAQQDCTDAKERGKGLSENLVFSTVVKGKYSISIEQDGKGKFISTFKLLGKGNSKISDSQKTGIEQEVQNSINTVLKDLKDPKDLNSLSNKTEVTDFGFYVKQMTGKEWIETLSDLGTTVWEEASFPKNYWNEDEAGYTNSTIRMPALFTGVADGVIGEVTSYPQLVKLGYDVATKEEVRTGLWNSVKNISLESIKNAAVDFYEQKKANYTSDKSYIVNHTVGKDGVELASILMGGTGGIKKAVKNVDEGVEKAGKEIKDAIQKKLDDIDEFMKTPDFKNLMDNSWKKYKGQLTKTEWEARYKTLYKNREVGKLTEVKFQELMSGEPKIFKFQGETRKVDNVIGTTAREIKSGTLKGSEFIDNQLRKDIMMLKQPNVPIEKIEWHLFGGVDKNMIEKLEILRNTFGKDKFDFIIY
ncbi:hypothetical protein PG326_10580, partial [Riemerella anatipestifer]|nr:hypothetical protein [Riemerella anatipestifer]MDY3358758.1 hypothetical protein [Riemerella anatipestifer]